MGDDGFIAASALQLDALQPLFFKRMFRFGVLIILVRRLLILVKMLGMLSHPCE